MLFSNKKTTEDELVEILSKHPYTEGPDLLELLRHRKDSITKQAMYYALEKLADSEIVSKAGTRYFLSKVWINKVSDLILRDSAQTDSVLRLQEGESVSYHFQNLLAVDTYWAHIFHILTDAQSVTTPVCVWYPHNWFVIARTSVEKEVFTSFIKQKKRCLISIGGKTDLDRDFVKVWSTQSVPVSIGIDNPLGNDTSVCIFEDTIIEVVPHHQTVKDVEYFYQIHKNITPENKVEVERIVSRKIPARIKVYKNKKKAELLRKKLWKNFL